MLVEILGEVSGFLTPSPGYLSPPYITTNEMEPETFPWILFHRNVPKLQEKGILWPDEHVVAADPRIDILIHERDMLEQRTPNEAYLVERDSMYSRIQDITNLLCVIAGKWTIMKPTHLSDCLLVLDYVDATFTLPQDIPRCYLSSVWRNRTI